MDDEKIRQAIKTLGNYDFSERMRRVDGHESHRILPEIWPVIQEICTIADACKDGKIKPCRPGFFVRMRRLFRRESKDLTESQIRSLFKQMHSKDSSIRRLADSRRLGK